ncbi:MAG: VRR-NUC domain-containing protein [Myxococcota bacterium]|nr:VRR-NUC domain-containing protein [Myxococcota bacterium]
MEPIDLPPDYPRTIAEAAVKRGMTLESHLLSAGEMCVIRAWRELSHDDAHVYARLLWRKKQPVRVDSLVVPGVSQVDESLTRLERRGFIDRTQRIPSRTQRDRMTVPELKTLARDHGMPTSGSRSALLKRLANTRPGPRAPELVQPRHAGLFQRMNRTHLQDHTGDLSKVVLEQIGVRTPVDYTVTGGTGRFRNRSELRGYEAAIGARAAVIDKTSWAHWLDEATAQLAALPLPAPHRWRFSARRFWEEVAGRALRAAERDAGPAAAHELYQRHLSSDLFERSPVLHRAALTAGRSGRPGDGHELCTEPWHDGPSDYARVRTGKRLAKQAGTPWAWGELPPPPVTRVLKTPMRHANGRWTDGDRVCSVETLVIDALAADGLDAFHVEGALWSTLFGLLYEEALFVPVHGMLPSPHLRAPLDLGTPDFRHRRASTVDAIESDILNGLAHGRLCAAWEKRLGQSIVGVHWGLMGLDDLLRVVDGLPPLALTSIMQAFSVDWWNAQRGWPDLVVLSEDSGQLRLVEVKGPSDSLRDAQRWWLAELEQMGISNEVWSVVSFAG